MKQAVLAVQREMKKRKLTQDQAIELGLEARHGLLRQAQEKGTQVHEYIQAVNNGREYELDQEYSSYGKAYYDWFQEHDVEPVIEEKKLVNFQHGYAGRLDFYGKLDGRFVLLDFKTSKSVRWTYGLQLAAYRKCLEDMGHKVDAMYVVHVNPKKRSNIKAELHEFTTPFQVYADMLKVCRYKIAQDPYLKWEPRSDYEALKKELDVKSSSELEPQTDVLGRQQDTQGTSPSTSGIWFESPQVLRSSFYQRPEGITILSPSERGYQPVQETPTSRNSSQPETPSERTSLRRTDSQPGTHTEESPPLPESFSERSSVPSYRTPLDVSPLPSAEDISDSPELPAR
jgi:hypothetical protein